MNTTRDTLLGGKVWIEQPETGFRAGTDAILLAASLPHQATALEVGCGAGGALLPAAWRLHQTHVTGLEIDPDMAALARSNLKLNHFADRCEIVEADISAIPARWENRFELVFSNPPWFEPGRTSAPGEGKQGAYVESVSLNNWVRLMLFACQPKGSVVIIHRAAELATVLAALDRRAGEIVVMPIRPRAGAEARRILVRARKALKRGPVRLLDGLELEDEARLSAIMQGGALDWR